MVKIKFLQQRALSVSSAVIFFIGLMLGTKASAQILAFNASSSANSIAASNTLTYTIEVANVNNSTPVTIWVTNALSAAVKIVGVTTNYTLATVETNGNTVIFNVPNVQFLPAQMTLSVQPTNALSLTNTITLATFGGIEAMTNLVTTVTNAATSTNGTPDIEADAGISIIPPSLPVLTNDYMTYSVTVSNVSGATANNVVLSNHIPASVIFRSISPSRASHKIINLGNLTNGAVRTFRLTVEPTEPGSLTFRSTIISSSDSNAVNNSASFTIDVGTLLTNEMVATLLSAEQTFNPQNGLFEQPVRLSNLSSATVPSSRVMVSNIPKDSRLFNAVGTNAARPFVAYAYPIAAGAYIDLLLQFKISSYVPFGLTDDNLEAAAVPAIDVTPPANLGNQVPTNRIVQLSSGSMLIEFASTNNAVYTIVYADDVSFTNAAVIRPSVVAPANWTQWIDYGPPATISHPTVSTSRFYKIFRNP